MIVAALAFNLTKLNYVLVLKSHWNVDFFIFGIFFSSLLYCNCVHKTRGVITHLEIFFPTCCSTDKHFSECSHTPSTKSLMTSWKQDWSSVRPLCKLLYLYLCIYPQNWFSVWSGKTENLILLFLQFYGNSPV